MAFDELCCVTPPLCVFAWLYVPSAAGRLLHHLAEVSGFKLSGVEVVVFDEADRMFEMGFAEQVGNDWLHAAMPMSSTARQAQQLHCGNIHRFLVLWRRHSLSQSQQVLEIVGHNEPFEKRGREREGALLSCMAPNAC